MALKAGYKGIKKCGPGLKYDNLTGTLKLDGESDLSLDNLKDVNITTPADGDYLTYDPTNEEWYNEQPDSTPTEDSPNLVTSGGVYAAIEDVDVTDLIPEGASSSNKLATASDVNDLWSANAVLGAKNLLPPIPQTYTEGSLTVTKQNDGSFELNGSTGASELNFVFFNTSTLSDLRGDFKFKLNVASISGIALGMYKSTSGTWSLTGANLEMDCSFTDAEHASGKVALYIASNKTFDHVLVKPTLTLASDTDSSYQPYAMTNGELTEAIFAKTPMLDNTVDLNDLKTTGIYGFSSTPINAPAGETYGTIIVQKNEGNDSVRQILYTAYGASSAIFVRAFRGATPAWTSWYKFTGTAVS